MVLGLSRRRDDGRRVWWQAAAIGTVVTADGLVAYALGAPAWLALLYLVLGPVLAAGRVRLARRSSSLPLPLPSPSPSPALPAPPALPTPAPLRAIGYAVLDRPDNGELAEHTKAIKACCEQRGLALASIVHDVSPDASSNARPSLVWTLEQLAEGNADVLVVPRLRDLSRNVANLSPLLSWFGEENRRLIAIDLSLDTGTEEGRLAATAVAGVGGWEHELISERTRRGLDAARSRGAGQGRTAVADVPELAERIQAMRDEGMTLQAIADRLNEEGVPTLRGGAMWRPSSVQRATGYQRPTASSRGIELPRTKRVDT